MAFYNLARMYTTTTGTGVITLTTAVPGFKTFANAGVPDSDSDVSYGLITYDLVTHRPVGSECGIGQFTAPSTFTRHTVESSTDSDDSAIDLTGLTEIYLCPIASDLNTGL